MWNFLNELTLAQVAWLLVIFYILHYAEEGPRLVEWFNKHFPIKGISYTQKKLNLENIFMFTHTSTLVVLINIYPDHWFIQGMILGAGCGFFILTFFHGIPTWHTGIYSPGAITACMFHPPLFLIFVWKAYQFNLLTAPIIIVTLVSAALTIPLYVSLIHKVLLKTDSSGYSWLDWFPVRAKPLPWKVVYYQQEKK
jgi:hypothetical protein